MQDRYAVFGNPIGHSRSPAIHTLFAEQTAQSLTYEAICAPMDQFAESVNAFLETGGKGLNVTVPFKEQAWQLASRHSERAQRAGAVNTLRLDADGELYGDNTDGVGLVRDLTQNHQVTLAGKRVLVLGAGGAVRGILQPLLAEQPAEVVIANRTVSRAQLLAEQFADLGKLSCSEFVALDSPFDVVINGTAASLQGELPPISASIITANTVCYDMMYGADVTAFNRWALDFGAAKALDGLGMLVEQAAEAFLVWRGVMPKTQVVIRAIREQLLTI